MKTITFVIGPTNSGKTTLVESLHKSSIGSVAIHVGRLLREKHPPEFFEGQGNPPHVHKEAMRLLFENLRENLNNPTVFNIYVDGQPRTVEQVEEIERFIDTWSMLINLHYIVLNAPDEVLRERAHGRDSSPHAVELSIQRLINDKCDLHDALHHLMCISTLSTKITFIGRNQGYGFTWLPDFSGEIVAQNEPENEAKGAEGAASSTAEGAD